ncbi:MAG: ParB N-terminal domain-containing protein [Paracoccaceae bacterium]|nr:ParB N-terminal domain-containing protein [Paracoccaceae bacterium]
MKLAEISLSDIAADILPRDRALSDPAALDDLIRSITAIGLRQPIEVFGLMPTAEDSRPYGLISGYRRLAAFRAMGRRTIPALCCNPADIPAALTAMVTENELRTQISPWEKGCLLLNLVGDGVFADAGCAVDTLYPAASRQSRARLRGFYLVVAALIDAPLHRPETLTTARMDRLATALRLGGGGAILATLAAHASPAITPSQQWEALRPIINTILTEPAENDRHPNRPRHALTLRQGVTLTRARAPNGWTIRLTGPMAKSPGLVDDIFDLVERWLQPEG